MKAVLRMVQALLLMAFCTAPVFGQTYPAKPIRLFVPFPAGGVVDGMVRIVSQQASGTIGQSIVIENRPGASTMISTEACARAVPDGYTLCITSVDNLTFNPHLFTRIPYDPDNDFSHVTNLVLIGGVVVANPDVPFSTVKDLVAYAKAKPGALNWASFGSATVPHIYLEWIRNQTGADITHVPYKGSAQAVPALLSGEVHVTYVGLGFVMPQIKAGKMKPLAVLGTKRSPALPDVPTLSEQGLDPGLTSWVGVSGPAKIARPALDRLNAEFVKALRAPKVLEFLNAQSFEPVGSSIAEFTAFLKADRANAGRIFKAIGIKATDAPA